MSDSGPSAPHAGHPFTLWLDPARWPVDRLRLPGAGFSLWLDPATWPVARLRLPGAGFSLWLDPATWPVARLRLPGAGFSLWLDPASWPQPGPEPVAPAAGVEEMAEEGPGFPAAASLLPTAAETISPRPMPIILSQNKAFTLWTRPALVSPIPMKNGLTAAQLAMATSAQPAGMREKAKEMGRPEAAAAAGVERWLPLAAGVVAVLGVHALMGVAESKKAIGGDLERSHLQQDLSEAVRKASSQTDLNAAAVKVFTGKAAELASKAGMLQEQNDRLVAELAMAREDARKAESRLGEQGGVVRQLTMELNQAKLAAATAVHKAEGAVVAAQEEASRLKREAGATEVALRESLARLEAARAAAVKTAAESSAALAALQSMWDALQKPAP